MSLQTFAFIIGAHLVVAVGCLVVGRLAQYLCERDEKKQ